MFRENGLDSSRSVAVSVTRVTEFRIHKMREFRDHFFFFFYWRYKPLWVLVFSLIFFHSTLSSHCFLHRLTPIICISSSMSAIHLFLGLAASSAMMFMLPACRRVRTFQVPNRITIFVALLRSLVRFHKGSPASITEFFVTV